MNKLKNLKKGIEIIDGKVYVELIGNANIDLVPSNHNICLVTLDKVIKQLEKSGFGETYCQYCHDQEAAYYIEHFYVILVNLKAING